MYLVRAQNVADCKQAYTYCTVELVYFVDENLWILHICCCPQIFCSKDPI